MGLLRNSKAKRLKKPQVRKIGTTKDFLENQTPSHIEDGPGILNYAGSRNPIKDMHGGLATIKVKRARR